MENCNYFFENSKTYLNNNLTISRSINQNKTWNCFHWKPNILYDFVTYGSLLLPGPFNDTANIMTLLLQLFRRQIILNPKVTKQFHQYKLPRLKDKKTKYLLLSYFLCSPCGDTISKNLTTEKHETNTNIWLQLGGECSYIISISVKITLIYLICYLHYFFAWWRKNEWALIFILNYLTCMNKCKSV